MNKPAPAECVERNTSLEEQGPRSNQLEPGRDIRIETSRKPCAASNYQCDSLCQDDVFRTYVPELFEYIQHAITEQRLP